MSTLNYLNNQLRSLRGQKSEAQRQLNIQRNRKRDLEKLIRDLQNVCDGNIGGINGIISGLFSSMRQAVQVGGSSYRHLSSSEWSEKGTSEDYEISIAIDNLKRELYQTDQRISELEAEIRRCDQRISSTQSDISAEKKRLAAEAARKAAEAARKAAEEAAKKLAEEAAKAGVK